MFLLSVRLLLYCRFYPSAAQAIAERILAEELTNQVYEEEEAKYWSLNISDKVREAIHGIRFFPLSFSTMVVPINTSNIL